MSRVQVSVANKKMVLSCKFCSYRCKLRLNLIKHCLQTHSWSTHFGLDAELRDVCIALLLVQHSLHSRHMLTESILTGKIIYKEFDNIGGEGQSTQHVAARFLINFQEQYKLSQRAINFAVGSINTIVGSVLTSVQSTVEAAMLTETDLTSSFTFEDPFKSLKTEHQQSKFYREEFGLVVGSL